MWSAGLLVTASLLILATGDTTFVDRAVTASYPFLNGQRLATHQRADNTTVMLVGSGSGLFVVDVDTDPTAPILAPGILHNQVRLDASAGCSGVTTGGMIHSLAPAGVLGPTTPAVFAAAGHAGLFQLDAADYEITHAVYFGDVHVVALCPGGVLIAGTHSDAGKRAGVFAFATRTPAGEAALVPLWNFTTPDDVWSLACPRPSPSNDGSKSPFPLVAGGWCWGLHLYSADGHGAAAVTSWSDGKPLLARDALLDNGMLVVAANTRGLLGFRVNATTITNVWQRSTSGLATGLSPVSQPGEAYGPLAVTSVGTFGVQFQFFGSCALPKGCDQEAQHQAGRNAGGIILFDDAFTSQVPSTAASISGSFTSGGLWQATVVKQASTGQRFVIAMSPQLVVTPLDGSNHTMINHDQFGVFGNAADSLVAPEGTGALYVSIEQGVAVFCLNSAQCPSPAKFGAGVLDRPASYVNGAGCVAIAASPVGFHQRLFCTAQSAGISVFDVSAANRFNPVFMGHLTMGDAPIRPYAPPVLIAALGSTSRLWLYEMMTTTTLVLFDVTDPNPALDPILCKTQLTVGTPNKHQGRDGPFLFGIAVFACEGVHFTYCAYSVASTGEIGIYVIQTTISTGEPKMQLLGKVVAGHNRTDAQAAYMTLDRERGRLFVAYSCAGVAMYDLLDPSKPHAVALRSFSGQMVFQVSLIPGSSLVLIGLPDNQQHGTAAAMERGAGIAVVDATTPASFDSGAVQILPVAFSAIAQLLLSPPSRGLSWFELVVADGAAGLYLWNVTLRAGAGTKAARKKQV
jgi:hypothetical protein